VPSPNWKNHTLWTGDNLPIMRGLNSGCVDLVYLDPPFNSNRTYAAPIGSKAAGAAFKDYWTFDDVDRLWLLLLREKDPQIFQVIEAARMVHGKGMAAYLSMMAQRLQEIRRLLKSTGSVYLHCDPTASHYLKMLMDSVFGKSNFRNEIVWDYTFRLMHLSRFFNRKHDVILFYSRSAKSRITMPTTPWTRDDLLRTRKQKVHLDSDGDECIWMPGGKGNSKSRLKKINDIIQEGKAVSDVWPIPVLSSSAKERVGYPTQKPLALLERIVKASSRPGDVVLDPFCGCATACVSAERWGRQWIGIDISEKAAELVQSRIRDESQLYNRFKPIHRTDQPHRTDLGPLPPPARHKNRLYGRQSGQCGGCMVMFPKRNLTLDHIVPRAKGGTDHLENLWLLCGACNSSKGTKSQAEFLRDRVKRSEPIGWLQ